MRRMRWAALTIILSAMGCASTSSRTVQISPQMDLVQAIADAKPGDVIQVEAGEYHFDKPLRLAAKGTEDQPICLAVHNGEHAVFDFSAEPEDEKHQHGVEVAGEYWHLDGIEVAHSGSYGFCVTGNHNTLTHCISRENRSTGTQIEGGGSYNLFLDCESFRNFDPKTLGENADGFAAKHDVGPGNVFRGCRSYQNSDDGWDLWMAPNSVLIEDCVSFRNGYNIFGIADFQGDGNGFKFGGNYVAVNHICRRCVSFENPLHGFDQNHNTGAVLVEDCMAIRCGKGFSFPETPRQGQVTLRRDTSFGCQNVLEPGIISEDNHWYSDIPTGTLGPPPRPGHRNVKGAGEVPTTEPTPMMVPENAPRWGRPSDTPTTQPYPDY